MVKGNPFALPGMPGTRPADDPAATVPPPGVPAPGGHGRQADPTKAVRTLRLVLGDQLQHDSPLFVNFDPCVDRIVMIEAPDEATGVRGHKARIALHLSAMRHFAEELRARKLPFEYVALDDPRFAGEPTLVGRVGQLLQAHSPQQLMIVEPGDWRVHQAIRELCEQRRLALPAVLPDTHFMCSRVEFSQWARGQRDLRVEYFYRWMRRRHRVLLDPAGEPEGVQWNYDDDSRTGYPTAGPGDIPAPERFEPDAITREVFALVERRFPEHPGSLDHFGWPVTRAQALKALARFVQKRLASFGPFQEALWTDTPFGWHSLLSTSLNLKLLDPREAIEAVEQAFQQRRLPLSSVEGFVRQVLGWREYVRGVYWKFMPGLAKDNYFDHHRKLPAWYRTGETSMACMRESIKQTLAHGYASNAQRLLVTGQFGLLAEVEPAQLCDWYLAMHVDAVDWAARPNTAGMALFADGGRFTTRPGVVSGEAIARRSNYCARCRYKPQERAGEQACPVTVLYWNFLEKNFIKLSANRRLPFLTTVIQRLRRDQRAQIRTEAARLLERIESL